MAGRETRDPVLALVVRLVRARTNRYELALPFEEHQARREDAHAFDRIAALVGHASGDDAHARHCEVDLLERLSVRHLDGPADLAGTPLSVLEPEIAAT